MAAFPCCSRPIPGSGSTFSAGPRCCGIPSWIRNGKFKKYVLRYWHDAQPRNDGRGAPQTSTLISHVEGNSLLMWNTQFDAAATDSGNKLIYGDYGSTVAAVPPPAPNAHQASSAQA